MKNLLGIIMLLAFISCSDNAKNTSQRTNDSTALEAIDSSVIMNDSTRLPQDSSTTTVAH